MSKLTERQQQVLKLIQRAIAQTGAPPTRAEIATELGFRSANAAEEHLQALSRKGVIELVSGTSRGIRLRGEALRDLNDDPDRQMMLPIAGLNQLLLPLIGRVAAGSPILAAAHVEQSYHLEPSLFQRRPDYLLKVRGMSMRDAGIMDGEVIAWALPEMYYAIEALKLHDPESEEDWRSVQNSLQVLGEMQYGVFFSAKEELERVEKGLQVAIIRPSAS